MMSRFAIALFALFTPLAHAHPGAHHGDLWAGFVHLMSEPDHLALVALAALIGGVLGYRRLRRHRVHQ